MSALKQAREAIIAAQVELAPLTSSSRACSKAHALLARALFDLAELDATSPMTDDPDDDEPRDVVFSLDDGMPFTGQSDGEKWNGFDVVYVSADTLDVFLDHVAKLDGYAGEQAEADAARLTAECQRDGHACLRGFATTIHEEE